MLLWQGRRNAARHQTPEATLDWSYNLLPEAEKNVLITLSIFVGAFTLEMAQAILLSGTWRWTARRKCHCEPGGQVVALGLRRSMAQPHIGFSTQREHMLRPSCRSEARRMQPQDAMRSTTRSGSPEWHNRIPKNRDLTAYSRHVGDITAALEWCYSKSGDRSVAVPSAPERCNCF